MGCGAVATYGHIPAIQRTIDLELKAVFEPDSARLIDVQAGFHVANGFTDPELFMQSGLDAVVICSPAPTHLENLLMCAKARKPVLCEKPLAMTESDAVKMIDAMKAASVPLWVGFNYRFAPCALEIKRLIDRGSIGKVRSLRLIYNWDCHGKFIARDPSKGENSGRAGRMLEGGPMVDCGVHQIDLARWWLGSDVTSFTSNGAWVDSYDAPDHLYLHMEHACGAHTMVEVSYSYGHTSHDQRSHFVYEIIGTEGLIRYDRQGRVFEVLGSARTDVLDWHEEKNFDGMYEELARTFRSKDKGNMPTGDDGLVATRIARAATDLAIAARSKRTL
jgi:predicted dehydrogenase